MDTNDIKITVEYKNDEKARHNFIEFLIDFLIESNDLKGSCNIDRDDSNV